MKEAEYTHITYDTTLHFASTLASLNRDMVFGYVSGQMTDSTEKGNIMWAMVKGRTENALMRLSFERAYNFRPGLMKPAPGQQNVKPLYKFRGGLYPIFRAIFPNVAFTLKEVGLAIINGVRKGYSKQILDVKDMKFWLKLNSAFQVSLYVLVWLELDIQEYHFCIQETLKAMFSFFPCNFSYIYMIVTLKINN